MESRDADLVAEALRGSRESREELVRRHRGPLYTLVLAQVRDAAMAEDVTQEAMLRAIQRLDRCENTAGFGAWVAGIGRNCAREALRRKGRDRPVAELDRPTDPEDRALVNDLLTALDTLDDRSREVILLKYQSGLSCKEISAALGLSLSLVKVTLFRAYEKLRQRMCHDV